MFKLMGKNRPKVHAKHAKELKEQLLQVLSAISRHGYGSYKDAVVEFIQLEFQGNG